MPPPTLRAIDSAWRYRWLLFGRDVGHGTGQFTLSIGAWANARAAQLMVTRHIHRLVGSTTRTCQLGVVSSLDLLRVLLKDPDVGPDA
jgi:hypothetical protein